MKTGKEILKKLLALSAFIIIGMCHLSAQVLSQEQEQQFRKEIDRLIGAYAEANQITTDWVSVNTNLVNKLKGMFLNTPKQVVFNDLLPPKVTGDKYLTPIAYVLFAQQNYREGLDVSLNVLEVIILSDEHKNDICKALVKAKKTVRGLYLGKRIHSFSDIVYIYIEATLVGTSLQSTVISMVADATKHAQVQGDKKYGGLYVGLSGGYNQNVMMYPNLNSSSIWSWQMGTSIMPTLEIHYMFNRGFGFATGVRAGNYSPGLSLKNFSGQLSSPITDDDDDLYYPIYEISNLEEVSTIKTIDIPMYVKIRAGSGKVGFYLDFGVVYSLFNSMSYTLSGTATRKGYYPDFDVVLEDIPEYNFYTNTTFSANDVMELTPPKNGFSGYASMGLSVAVYKNMMLRIGASANYGLVDMRESVPHHSIDYFSTSGVKPGEVFLHSASVELGLYYRVFHK